MANFDSWYRTSFFKVTDEKKLREIVDGLEDAELFISVDLPGYFAFGGEGSYGNEDDDDDEQNDTVSALQSILPDGEAVVIQLCGHEKLRYVVGSCLTLTNRSISSFDMQDIALQQARQMTHTKDLMIDFD